MTATPSATVLIVDDSPENLVVLSELLRPQYRVLAATSGAGGLRVANSLPKPDLILLDVMMPGMDGHAVLAQLRDNPATRDIPVVFLTALAAAEDEERGLMLGAADYFFKPIKPTVVLARARTQLDARQARDWLTDQNATPVDFEVAKVAPPEHAQLARTWRQRAANNGLACAKVKLVQYHLLPDGYQSEYRALIDQAKTLFEEAMRDGDDDAPVELFKLLMGCGTGDEVAWAHATLTPSLLQACDSASQLAVGLQLANLYRYKEGAF